MKNSKVMEERIRRVIILFKELGYKILETERTNETFSAGFENKEGLQGGFFIDRSSKFLEVAYTFSFSPSMADFVKSRLEEMLKVCYEYGSYVNIQTSRKEIAFSVFAKIYYSGLNYSSLKDTVREFRQCVEAITDLMQIFKEEKQ